MQMIQALFLIGQAELTSINTVADMTLYVGINPPFLNIVPNARTSAFVVTVDGVEDGYHMQCTAAEAHAVLRLFIEGDGVDGAARLYKLACPLMPDTIDSPFRCIP